MNVEIMSKTAIRELIDEKQSHRFDYVYKELTLLRKQLRKLEEEIKKGKLNSGFSSWEKYIEFLFYNQRKKEGTK